MLRLLNRFEVGHDGKTAHERNKTKVLGMEFGEATLWKRRPVGGALGKLSCLWEEWLFLGTDRFPHGGGVEDQDGAEEARRPLAGGSARDDPEDAMDRCG